MNPACQWQRAHKDDAPGHEALFIAKPCFDLETNVDTAFHFAAIGRATQGALAGGQHPMGLKYLLLQDYNMHDKTTTPTSLMSREDQQTISIMRAHFSSDSHKELFSEIMTWGMALLSHGVEPERLARLAVDWPGSTVDFQRELVNAFAAWENTLAPVTESTTKH